MSKQILMLLEREFPPDIRVEKEIEALTKHGYHVHLASYTKIGASALEELDGLTIHRKPISEIVYKSSVAALLFPVYFHYWNGYVRELTQRYSIDAIHVHDLPLAKVGAKWSEKLNIPLILDLHENWPSMLKEASHTNTLLGKMLSWNWQWEKYERAMVSKSDAVITVVDEMKHRVASLTGDPNKVYVYQNVPDLLEQYKANHYSPPKNEIRLAYLGGVNSNRGIQTVLKAIKLLPDNIPLKFTVIGAGMFLDDLMQLSADLEIEDMVTFTGFLPQDVALEKLRDHHLAIIPHYRSVQTDNSSPNKLFQYMMMGLPVISSDCTSLVRVIEDCNCGVYYKDYSEKDLSEKLNLIITTPSLLSEYSMNAHESVLNKFNAEKERLRLINTYQTVFNY